MRAAARNAAEGERRRLLHIVKLEEEEERRVRQRHRRLAIEAMEAERERRISLQFECDAAHAKERQLRQRQARDALEQEWNATHTVCATLVCAVLCSTLHSAALHGAYHARGMRERMFHASTRGFHLWTPFFAGEDEKGTRTKTGGAGCAIWKERAAPRSNIRHRAGQVQVQRSCGVSVRYATELVFSQLGGSAEIMGLEGRSGGSRW